MHTNTKMLHGFSSLGLGFFLSWNLFPIKTIQIANAQTLLEKYSQVFDVNNLSPKDQADLLYYSANEQFQVNEFQEAARLWQRALKLYVQIDNQQGEMASLFSLGITSSYLEKYDEAVVFYENSFSIANDIEDRKQVLNITKVLGVTYLILREYEKADTASLQFLDAFNTLTLSEQQQEFDSISELGLQYNDNAQYKQAINLYQKALEIAVETSDLYKESKILHRLGVSYGNLAEYEQAIVSLERSLKIARRLAETEREAYVLVSLARTYRQLFKDEQAAFFIDQAAEAANNIEKPEDKADFFGYLGNIYRDFENYEKGIILLQRSIDIHRKINNLAGEAGSLLNLGNAYAVIGEYEKSAIVREQSLLIFREIGDRHMEAHLLNHLGSTYNASGQYEKAIRMLMQSLEVARELGNSQAESGALGNLGVTYSLLGQYDKALVFHQKSFDIEVERKGLLKTSPQNLGLVYYELGKYQQALTLLSQSLEIERRNRDLQGEVKALYGLGVVYSQIQQYDKAISSYEKAIEILEKNRGQLLTIELRQNYFRSVQSIYLSYLGLLMDLYRQNPTQDYALRAFEISEKSRARVLLELLTESNTDINTNLEPVFLQREQALSKQLNQAEQQRIAIFENLNSTDEQKQAVNQKLEQTLAEFQELENEIRLNNPKYADLQYPETISVTELQNQILDEDTVLLQYLLGEENSYLWVVTKESFHSYELPSEVDITQTAKALLGEPLTSPKATNPVLAASLQQQRLDLTRQLSAQIIQPAAAHLTKKRIVIVPDGELNYFPFSILTTGTSETKTLSEQFELVNLPSSSTLATIRKNTVRPIPDRPSLSIFADPVFSTEDCRFTNSPNCDQDRLVASRSRSSRGDYLTWDDLPGTYTEASNILKLFPDKSKTKAAFGFAAQRDQVLAEQLKNYDLIHFATHGFFHQTKPEQSGLVFSLVDEVGDRQNGFLRLDSIFNMQLDASLVVLSACQTGVGEEIPGEGIVGLSRGFMYAGTPRLLMSLWQVDDAATAEFMTRFYKNLLEEKQTAAAALKETQWEMREETEWTHPQYWAAFILQGDWQ